MANHEWYPRYPKDELTGPGALLSNEELGFFTRLRDFSWINGGIPIDEDCMQEVAEFCKISRYKFVKIFAKLERFFEIRDGNYFYAEDELKRKKDVEQIAKRRWVGKIAAHARWAAKVSVIKKQTPAAMPDAMHEACIMHPIPDPKKYLEQEGTPQFPPQPETKKQAEGGGIPPCVVDATTYKQTALPLQSAQQTQEVCSQRDIEQIRQKAISLGLSAPSKKLCQRIREKFLSEPIEAVLGFLVRWEEQNTVGLWNAKTAEDFRLEAARQQAGVPRKPSQQELTDRRLMQWAHERDQARRRG